MRDKPSYKELEEKLRELEHLCSEVEKEKEDVKQSRDLLWASIERMPFDFFAIDTDGRYCLQNSKCKAHWGDVIGKRPEDLNLPNDVKTVWKESNTRAFSGETVRNEWWKTLNGEERFFYNFVAPVEPQKKNTAIMGLAFDITDFKRITESLEISDNAIKSSLNAIAIADLDGKLTYVNPAFLALWGYESDEDVLGRSCLDFWKAKKQAQDVVENILEHGSWFGEMVANRQKGPRFSTTLSANLVKDSYGNPLCMVACFLDMTSQKRVEKALEESEERLKELAKLLPETVFEADLHGRLTFVNDSAFEAFGYTREDFDKGLNLYDMILPVDRDQAIANVQAVLAGKKLGLNYYTALRKDKSSFPATIRSVPIIRRGLQ